jgi:hypothetical protein
MQANDIVILNVTGTNGATRHQKTITRRFNGAGQPLNDDGKVDGGSQEVLRDLPNGDAVSKAPDFPQAEFFAAQQMTQNPATRDEGVEKLKTIQLAWANQLQAWESSSNGGSEPVQIAKSALAYLKEFHGFREDDGDWFVLKQENLDVVQTQLPDSRSLYTVSGTAIFG